MWIIYNKNKKCKKEGTAIFDDFDLAEVIVKNLNENAGMEIFEVAAYNISTKEIYTNEDLISVEKFKELCNLL